jgi:flagellar biosynthesis chaperone FliJ
MLMIADAGSSFLLCAPDHAYQDFLEAVESEVPNQQLLLSQEVCVQQGVQENILASQRAQNSFPGLEPCASSRAPTFP